MASTGLLGSLPSFTAATDAAPPAGGAAVGEVIIATAFGLGAMAGLYWLVSRHRAGRTQLLARAGAGAERIAQGLPAWAALPLALATVSLLVAVLGMYWDISLHIDQGRDPGPLANPAHYLILAGLFGIFASGYLAIGLPVGERPGPAAVRITRDWYVPVGGLLLLTCGGFALAAFPLDDLWHRVFGQDVTLWGPTHLMMIGGAGLTLIAQAMLLSEGLAERRRRGRVQAPPFVVQLRRFGIAGGLLIGLSTFQAEFDFGVPQFRMVFQPLLIAFAAGLGLTAARIWIGRGGALGAVTFFLIVRGALSLIVGPLLGETTPMFALYVAEALCIEGVALAIDARRRPLTFGVFAGLLVGTVGFAAEWGWSQLVMPLPWTADILPEAPICAVAAGVAGGVLGALLASALRGELPRPGVARVALVASLATFGALVANGLATTAPHDSKASISLDKVNGGREANATVHVRPADAIDEPAWLNVTAWQGGDLVISKLDRVSEGTYRSAEPFPITGDWKANVRVQDGRTIAAVPIYAPKDSAVPVAEVPARAHLDRAFVPDKDTLQREANKDAPGWLWTAASLVVLAIALGFIAILSWGAARVSRAIAPPTPPPSRHERRPGLVGPPSPVGGAS
jgi:hypothetical protein